MWGLDNLLDDISKKKRQFSDISNDIQKAFKAGVAVVEDYQAKVNKNIIYYATAILNPHIKFNLINDQCDDPAQIKADIRAYLKWECQVKNTDSQDKQGEIEFSEGASIHQLNLLYWACNTGTVSVSDID
jgi:hypothetical protein